MAKSNEDYWKERALELEEKWHTKSKETIERELAAYYRQSLQHIQRDIDALYGTFAKDNQLSMTDAKKLLQGDEFRVWRMDIKEYLSQIDATGDPALLKELNTLAMRSRITRLDKLYSETLMELSKLAEKTGQSMDKFLTEAYKDGYYRNLFEIGKKAGLVSTPVKVDNKQAENVLRTPWSGKNYSERIWRNDARLAETIKETVTQGIHRGSSLQKLSKQVADKMNVGINDAKRLVQTELNYVQNKSALDSIKEAGMGFYRVISTHDARTCQRCGDKDGEEVPVGDASPGDTLPPFHARCRCTIAASFGDGKAQKGRRIARDKDGKNTHIPAKMNYQDWKAVCIDKTKTWTEWKAEQKKKAVTTTANNGIIESKILTEITNLQHRIDVKTAEQANDFTEKRQDEIDELLQKLRLAKVKAAEQGEILTSKLEGVYEKADIEAIKAQLKDAPKELRVLWNLNEEKIKILNANYTEGTFHYLAKQKGININIVEDRLDGNRKPYTSTFHEVAHLFDHQNGARSYTNLHKNFFAAQYENGLFEKTLRQEADEYIAATMKKKRFTREGAGREISRELLDTKDSIAHEISDIWEGISKGEIGGRFYHKNPEVYWSVEGMVSAEAFAHMFAATAGNAEAVKQIQKYFPKSYGIFLDILKVLTRME